MKIRTNNEVKEFEEMLDRCPDTVWAITPSGVEYNLKNTQERDQAISLMLKDNSPEEPELYAGSYENELVVYPYILTHMPRVA